MQLTDAQVMTLALSIVIPLSMLIHSNHRITDTRDSLGKRIDDLKGSLEGQIASVKESLEDQIDSLQNEMQSEFKLSREEMRSGFERMETALKTHSRAGAP